MDIRRLNENFFIRHATAVAISALSILMLLVVVVFWQQDQAKQQAKWWLIHTYVIINHLESLFNKCKDVEVGQRGFLLTGNEAYLAPYQEALQDAPPAQLKNIAIDQHRSINQELTLLRKLTSDNPTQQSNLDEMDNAIQKLLDYLGSTIKEWQNHQGKIAPIKLDFHEGKELMDQIRSLVHIMEAEENHLLTLRIEIDKFNTLRNEWLTFSSLMLFYIVMTFFICIYQRNRAHTQTQMLHYTQELEHNEEELKMQQEELEASNEEMEEKNKALEEQNAQIQQQSEELAESQRLIEEKASEVQRTSQYKSEFLANMSHELRTPLNSLLILAKLLAANEEGNLTAEQVEEAHIIHNGGLELLGLINDILDLSKVEAGKLSLTVEDTALDSIVKGMQQQFVPIANDRGIAYLIHVADDLPQTLHTDAQRVEQILKNLLSNAFKFTVKGSVKLEIRRPQKTEIQRLSLDYTNTIAFSVIDTGIGIEESKFKEIFEAFKQEDGSIDRHYGGTGLGLTISRKFAHILGGEIYIASQKGEGSRFTLLLPVVFAHNKSEKITTDDASESVHIELKPIPKAWAAEFIHDDRKNIGSKDKVLLIIEDDAAFAATLMKIARKNGYKCLAAGDGKNGLLLAGEEPVTAIILDLTLPDIDGGSVLDQLKSNLKTRHIPVHIISGRDEAENTVPFSKGAIGYLTKPVKIEAINGVFAKIEDLLQAEFKQLLIIEDDKKNQIAIQSLLKKNDVKITIVDTGKSGIEQASKIRFDCIILDLKLPDMTGFEWLEKMNAEKNTAGLPPIVVYTARELSEKENRKLARYTQSVIIKGAKSPERLLDEVTLFLHSVESTLSQDQKDIIRMQHNPNKVLIGRTILLTDDDLRNTFALSKLLKTHGMNIVIADNGEMALEKLQEDKSIELVIMDIMMPIMDGYQAIQEIRAQKAYQNLPIIALTARTMPEEQEKCIGAGANDYLTKPVDIERLLTLLRVWLFKQEKIT